MIDLYSALNAKRALGLFSKRPFAWTERRVKF